VFLPCAPVARPPSSRPTFSYPCRRLVGWSVDRLFPRIHDGSSIRPSVAPTPFVPFTTFVCLSSCFVFPLQCCPLPVFNLLCFSIFQSGMEVNNAKINENTDESQVTAQKSEDHKKLLEYGIPELVADRLDEIYKSGMVAVIFNICLFESFQL